MLTDSYPREDHCRRLFLYDLGNREAYEIGSFYSDPAYPGPTRCDLHPNWSRDDRFVCIDSIHEGSRQMYLLDVSEFTSK
jgi:Tol biopolymer transport system component